MEPDGQLPWLVSVCEPDESSRVDHLTSLRQSELP
jgi:hypothetical protein